MNKQMLLDARHEMQTYEGLENCHSASVLVEFPLLLAEDKNNTLEHVKFMN